jgi:hypothetical protein
VLSRPRPCPANRSYEPGTPLLGHAPPRHPAGTQTEIEPHPQAGGQPQREQSAGRLDRGWPDVGPRGNRLAAAYDSWLVRQEVVTPEWVLPRVRRHNGLEVCIPARCWIAPVPDPGDQLSLGHSGRPGRTTAIGCRWSSSSASVRDGTSCSAIRSINPKCYWPRPPEWCGSFPAAWPPWVFPQR